MLFGLRLSLRFGCDRVSVSETKVILRTLLICKEFKCT